MASYCQGITGITRALNANCFSEHAGPVNTSSTRVEDDHLEGTSRLLQPPPGQEAVEHSEVVSLQRLPAALPGPEEAFESPFWSPLRNAAGVEGGGSSPHGFHGACQALTLTLTLWVIF